MYKLLVYYAYTRYNFIKVIQYDIQVCRSQNCNCLMFLERVLEMFNKSAEKIKIAILLQDNFNISTLNAKSET